jgi:cobaltochelatase CobT
VAVQLIVDYSGSMDGTKIETAIVSTDMMCEVISRSLRIPVEVLGFSGLATTRMAIFKSFDVPANSSAITERMIQASGEIMSDNADGEAIVWAYTRLLKRREKRKIMIVLSDGEPIAAKRTGSILRYTRKVIKEIEANRFVEIIGIGIEDDTVGSLYQDHVVIDNAFELEDALLTVIKSKILEGERV